MGLPSLCTQSASCITKGGSSCDMYLAKGQPRIAHQLLPQIRKRKSLQRCGFRVDLTGLSCSAMIGLVCSSTCCPMAWFMNGHIVFTAVFIHNTCATPVAHELITNTDFWSTLLIGQLDVEATRSE